MHSHAVLDVMRGQRFVVFHYLARKNQDKLLYGSLKLGSNFRLELKRSPLYTEAPF
jgi:hypothetical protein